MQRLEIILICNESDVMNLMSAALGSVGRSHFSTSNPDEALEVMKARRFDLAISDINLPDINGITFMKKARQHLPESAFFILSGYSREYTYESVIRAGADDFIRKPFTEREFLNKLKRIIHQRDLEEENRRLLKQQANLNDRLAALLALASDMTAELDVERLFDLIIARVTEAMEAERTSLYVIDWDRKNIWTKVAEKVGKITLPLGEGISGRVAETGETVNVADAWELPYFNRKFDEKHGFRTRSVLCLPIRNQIGERIGVIQVINKKDRDMFDSEDVIFLKGLASQVGIALENSLLHKELKTSFDRSISTLSATVDARHPLTAGHSQRVTKYSLMIAREMNLNDNSLEILKYAAILHDIGKIGISDHVLLKNGSFSPEERGEMNTHPLKTRDILENFHFPRYLREVPFVAAHHHEKVNGQGYPDGLTGAQMPLGSKIMAVADVFDALTSKRDYPKYSGDQTFNNEPMPLDKVISILESDAGKHFDESVVDVFLGCLPRILVSNREKHFSAEYVDETIIRLAPDLLNIRRKLHA